MKKRTKQAVCSKCQNKCYHEATIGMDGQPAWECQLCGNETERKIQKRPDEATPLTPSQINAITVIQRCKLERTQDEVKQFSVTQCGSFASVLVVVGSKSDEGTLASVFCRYRGHFFVRRGGGIEAVDVKRGNKAKARKYPLIYGWRTNG